MERLRIPKQQQQQQLNIYIYIYIIGRQQLSTIKELQGALQDDPSFPG